MSRRTIAIDIDDVLADNTKGFTEFSNQCWGTNLAISDYDEHWAKMWRVDNDEAERRAAEFHGSGVLSKYEHSAQALSALTQLKDSYNLIVITSRRTQTKGETLAWIADRYPGIFSEDTIHFAGIWDAGTDQPHTYTKATIAAALGVDYLIDDQLKHCSGVTDQGITTLLFGDYPWNQADSLPKGVLRVMNWDEVLGYFNVRA